MFSFVLVKSDVELVEEPMVLKEFGISRGGRAHVARMVTGIVPLASARMSLKEFNVSAKVARDGPFDRNVENHRFLRFSKCARADCLDVPR